MKKSLFDNRVNACCSIIRSGTLAICILAVFCSSALANFPKEKKTVNNPVTVLISRVKITSPAQSNTLKNIEVRGTVTDTSGVGLPGVNITIKGQSDHGTVTDVNGSYSIKTPENGTLIYNFVGFIRKEVAVQSREFISVKLQENNALLEDVVIVGYGTQQKSNVTGALTSVSSTDLLRTPTASLTNSLAGRLPGLLTVQSSGEPGADGSALYIRGFGSYQGTSPLILVDGIENAIDGIDANEVETVSVLKDAAATAVYGMKGANGVVLVTTKRGKTGKPVISLTTQVAAQQPIDMPKYLDSFNALTLFREALNNDGLNANLYTDEYLNKFRDRSNPTYQYLYPNVDWTKELIKPYSFMNQTNLNVSGGSSTARYFVSMSYLGQNGLYKYEDLNAYNINAVLNKYNFRSNIDIDLTPLLSLELNLSDVVRDRNYPTETSSTFWGEIRNTPSYLYPLTNPDGSVPGQKNAPASPYGRLTQFGYNRFFENTLSSITGFNLKLPFITPGLSFRTRFAFDAQSYRNINRKRNYSTYKYTADENETDLSKGNYEEITTGDGLLGFAVTANGSRKSTYEAYLNYDRVFSQKHAFTGMIRYNQSQSFTGTATADGAVAALPYKQLGLVGRANYSYDRKYVLEFDAGYNGSENFKAGNRMGFFPAASAGWIISNEPFLKGSKVLSLFKLRGSLGIVGVDNSAGRFAYLSTWQTGNSTGYKFGLAADGNSYSGAQESATGNEFLTWEKSKKANIGVDLEMFNGEIAFTGDIFSEKRTQILTTAKIIPDVIGVQNLPAINAGIVDNKGFEGELTWRKRFHNHNIMIRGSYSYATNRIQYAAEPVYALAYMALKGTQINEAYGLIAKGLFKDKADVAASPIQQFGPVQPGDIKYVDRNGDGVINTQDQGYLGKPTAPKSIMGLTVSYTYKQFDLNVLFQGATGGYTWLTGTSAWAFSTNSSVLADYLVGRWTPDNPDVNAKWPRLSSSNNVNNNQNSTFWLRSSDYLRLKNVEMGYTFSKSFVKKLGLNNLRAFVSGSNICTWDKVKIFDPEIPNGFGDYPQQRVINLGINVSM